MRQACQLGFVYPSCVLSPAQLVNSSWNVANLKFASLWAQLGVSLASLDLMQISALRPSSAAKREPRWK